MFKQQVNTPVVEKEKINLNEQNFDGKANRSGVVNFHGIQMSVWFILDDDWDDMQCLSRFCFLGMMQFLLNRGPWLYTRTQSYQKQVVEYEIKSNYTEEYSTIDRVGSEKRLAKKSVSCRINRFLISYLPSKQARLYDFKRVLANFYEDF